MNRRECLQLLPGIARQQKLLVDNPARLFKFT